MDITKKEQKVIQRALSEWETKGDLSAEEKTRLSEALIVMPFDWQRLSRYSFWAAIGCVLVAFSALFADRYFMKYLLELFNNVEILRILVPMVFAVACYSYGFYRQSKVTKWYYSIEAILFLGVMFTAIMIWQIGVVFDNGTNNIAPLFLIGCFIYGLIGFCARSGMIWLFFLLSLGNWFGAETGYASGRGSYWLGMNYPIRFVFFGTVMLTLCFVLQSLLRKRQLFTVSKAMGLTYLFIALWILSIFGSRDYSDWYSFTQMDLLPWAIIFLSVSILCIYISLKTEDAMLRGFGLTFLCINLYTRFFEYFWDSMHKFIFFLILAVSLAILGRYAERIWHTKISE